MLLLASPGEVKTTKSANTTATISQAEAISVGNQFQQWYISSSQYVHCGSGDNGFSQTPSYPTATSSASGLSFTDEAMEAPVQFPCYYPLLETNSTTNHALLSDTPLIDEPDSSQDKIYHMLKSIYPHLSDGDLRIVQ
jgi:hypothetical protein